MGLSGAWEIEFAVYLCYVFTESEPELFLRLAWLKSILKTFRNPPRISVFLEYADLYILFLFWYGMFLGSWIILVILFCIDSNLLMFIL